MRGAASGGRHSLDSTGALQNQFNFPNSLGTTRPPLAPTEGDASPLAPQVRALALAVAPGEAQRKSFSSRSNSTAAATPTFTTAIAGLVGNGAAPSPARGSFETVPVGSTYQRAHSRIL